MRHIFFGILMINACPFSEAVQASDIKGDIIGTASVTDGDTIEIHGQRIRLYGIDAPESGQSCEREGKHYRCGQQAATVLAGMIGRASVRCEQRDIDRYGRIVAVCWLGGIDLNAKMVSKGWAMAYRRYAKDYVNHEAAAQTAKAGIWAGRFVEPEKWRRGERLATAATGPENSCRVKGNINRDGERVYHVPGSRFYEQTRINESKGERWFCSPQEAETAGWRRAR